MLWQSLLPSLEHSCLPDVTAANNLSHIQGSCMCEPRIGSLIWLILFLRVSLLWLLKSYCSNSRDDAENSCNMSQLNLFLKDSVQCSVLVDVKRLLVPQVFDVDRFSWVKAESFAQFLDFIIEQIDLLLTAVDAPRVLLYLPAQRRTIELSSFLFQAEFIKDIWHVSVSHCHNHRGSTGSQSATPSNSPLLPSMHCVG